MKGGHENEQKYKDGFWICEEAIKPNDESKGKDACLIRFQLSPDKTRYSISFVKQ